jgi:hypothetical protein
MQSLRRLIACATSASIGSDGAVETDVFVPLGVLTLLFVRVPAGVDTLVVSISL